MSRATPRRYRRSPPRTTGRAPTSCRPHRRSARVRSPRHARGSRERDPRDTPDDSRVRRAGGRHPAGGRRPPAGCPPPRRTVPGRSRASDDSAHAGRLRGRPRLVPRRSARSPEPWREPAKPPAPARSRAGPRRGRWPPPRPRGRPPPPGRVARRTRHLPIATRRGAKSRCDSRTAAARAVEADRPRAGRRRRSFRRPPPRPREADGCARSPRRAARRSVRSPSGAARASARRRTRPA